MAFSLSEINRRCREDAVGFIQECDEVYERKLELAAAQIRDNLKHSPIVLLSGPSGSGKTTTSMKVCEVLEKSGIRTHSISMDNYFKNVTPEDTPRTPEGKYDLESPLCLDMDLLNAHFTALSQGRVIEVPRFDFVHRARSEEPGEWRRLRKDEIAVFEGIHAFNDAITTVHPEAFKLYVSVRNNIVDDDNRVVFKGTWMRLMRRTVRDFRFRGTQAQSTLASWAVVRRGEKLYISPNSDKADLKFDSAFPYEVPVLNNIVTDLFNGMPEDTPRYSELRALLSAFTLFEDLSPDLLAPDSLIREFVGGGIYQY